MENRIAAVTKKFPWFVIERRIKSGNQLVGYAYANTWNTRESYRYTAESSVYLDPSEQGHGLGEKIYRILLDELEQMNIHVVIGGISLPNSGSVRLHEKLGFEKIGHFKAVGYKYDQWVDVGYWQKTFNNSDIE